MRILFGRERRTPVRYRAEGYAGLAATSIGYGLLVTGLACLTAAAALAAWLVWLMASLI